MTSSLRTLVGRHGLVGGALQRLRAGMDLAAVDDATVRAHLVGIEANTTALETTDAMLRAVHGQLEDACRDQTAALAALAASAAEQREAVARDLAALRAGIGSASAASARNADEVDPAALLAFTQHVRALGPVADPPLVSVIVPTCQRPELLLRALGSIRAQTHPRWEAIVCDDGERRTAGAVVDALADPRIRLAQAPGGRGCSAARNSALEAARGTLITYLDDDCVLAEGWLAAVAWVFDGDPGLEVAYGVRTLVIDGVVRLFQPRWDRARLERDNVADTNVLAHRAGLAAAGWDEDLACAADWDLLSRLTVDRDPAVIPALAASYDATSPDRVSDGPRVGEEYERVRQMVRARRGLRVLGVNAMFPLLSETYIHDELHALEQRGVALAWCRVGAAVPAPMPVDQPVFTDLDVAVETFRPDLLMLHWATFAHGERVRLAGLGIPYGVRVHSFDFAPDLVSDLLAEPLCIGVWRYPAEAYASPGTHELPPIFSTVAELPPPASRRDIVLSASAALPKKDWPTLTAGMGALAGVDCRIVTSVTVGHEDEPAKVFDLCARVPHPPLVQVNCTRDVVHGLLARTALFVYTLEPGARFGMPMSIAEALCAGCSVVVPDRPEARAYAGPHARTYQSPGDIARHAREVLDGGPAVEAERAANRAWGLEHFCDPAVPDRFLVQVHAGLDGLRAEQLVMA